MKCLLLCAGYATRLYPLTLDKPKHLLPVAGKPMLNYIMDKLQMIDEIDEIYLITNNKFYSVFLEWSKTLKISQKIKVHNDETISDETKLGAVGDINFILEREKVNDDLLVIAGDNLFELNLNDFISFYKKYGTSVAVRDVEDKELIKKYGQVELDRNNKIIDFIEKPHQPKTTLAAICMYLFSKDKLYLVKKYIEEGNNLDQPGRYIQWLYKKIDVYGFVFTQKWYDIGDISQYKEADKDYLTSI